VAHWVPGVLALCVPALLAWFPGFNARQRGHEHPRGIVAASWALTLAMAWLVVMTKLELSFIALLFLAAWTGLAVWSYGKRDALPALKPASGFEIKLLQRVSVAIEHFPSPMPEGIGADGLRPEVSY